MSKKIKTTFTTCIKSDEVRIMVKLLKEEIIYCDNRIRYFTEKEMFTNVDNMRSRRIKLENIIKKLRGEQVE